MLISESYLLGEILLKFGPNGAVPEAGDDSEAGVDVLADLVVHIRLPRHFRQLVFLERACGEI